MYTVLNVDKIRGDIELLDISEDKWLSTPDQIKVFPDKVRGLLRLQGFLDSEVIESILDVNGPGLVPAALVWYATLYQEIAHQCVAKDIKANSKTVRVIVTQFLNSCGKDEAAKIYTHEMKWILKFYGFSAPQVNVGCYSYVVYIARKIHQIVLAKQVVVLSLD